MRKGGNSELGFTLIEVMIAAGLTSIVFLSMLSVVADYSELFRDAQTRTTMMSLRRRVIQNLNRRDAWTNTFLASDVVPTINSEMRCLWDIYPTRTPCAQSSAEYDLVVLARGPIGNAVNLANATVINAKNVKAGFTRAGVPCTSFEKGPSPYDSQYIDDTVANTPAAKRCPIRLEVKWRLRHNGIDRQYYPTGYLPSGYYASSYWPAHDISYYSYWWFGTVGAQVEVFGRFYLNEFEMGKKINLKNYDFYLLKSVP